MRIASLIHLVGLPGSLLITDALTHRLSLTMLYKKTM